jgi:hypothetical protein
MLGTGRLGVYGVIWAVACGVGTLDYARVQMFAGEPGGWENRQNRESKLPKQERGWWFGDVPSQLTHLDYPLENSALFILANIPEGETICMRDIGFPGYMSMNPIWDTAGLVTPTAARARRDRSDEMQAEMVAELLRVRPAVFRLVLPRDRVKHINWRLYRWLSEDPVAKSIYRRARPRGEVQDTTTLVVYLRRDLPDVDYDARLGKTMERLPAYASRLRERDRERD